MNTIGIYKFDQEYYGELIEKLKNLNITIKPLEDGKVEDGIDMYIFDLDKPEEFDELKFDRPFVIISLLNDQKYFIKSRRMGAIDYISKPFLNLELTVQRIQRLLEKVNVQNNIKVEKSNSHDKIIDIELKRAQRGKYPLTLMYLKFDLRFSKETMIKIIDNVKTALRDSDSCIPYSDQSVVAILPFADKIGANIVVKKVSELLKFIGFNSTCVCANYPEDGETSEDLFKYINNSLIK